MKLYKNVDMVQINVKAGVQEYFLPKNVDWADKVIDKIVVYCPMTNRTNEYSPIDGVTKLISRNEMGDLYFNLYSNEDVEIAHNLSAEQILFTNNHPIEINSKLSLLLSRIFFAKENEVDGCLLLYVYYGSVDVEEDDIPRQSVTVQFSVPGKSEISLDDVIDTYIHGQGAKLRGIIKWGYFTDGMGCFLTLRDRGYNTILKSVPVNMMRPPMKMEYAQIVPPLVGYQIAEKTQVSSLYLDYEDIDFANSNIQNTYAATNVLKLTFLY